ncbi:phage baseplate assembly protein domain-containing protein [Pararhizobium sp. O133]|uniref:phage baseplate assembly protein domain-containing protein n=1 Tax=Pararhizobium sp. O133 TaxID=3449278 RepID=UPI003F683744
MSGTRFEFDGKVTHKAGQQFVNGRGLFSDGFTRVHRLEPHGFASVPVKGATGFLVTPNGNADEAYVIGGEKASLRPGDLPAGASALYDHNGNIIKLIGDGVVMDFQSHTVTMTAGTWTVTGDFMITGNVSIVGNLAVDGNITATGSNPNHHSH